MTNCHLSSVNQLQLPVVVVHSSSALLLLSTLHESPHSASPSPTLSFTVHFFPFVLALSIFLLFHPFSFYQNRPTPFPGRRSQEATKPEFSFLLILCCMWFLIKDACLILLYLV